MKPFKKRRRGGICATFEANEAEILTAMASQIVELLRDRNAESASDPDPLVAQFGLGGPSQPPEDPVLRRLLPDAYRDDADDAAEFRRFTEASLSAGKAANAGTLIASLADGGFERGESGPAEVELDDMAVQAWLRSLTDIRLALAVRLGIEDESDHEIIAHSEDEAIAVLADIYDWLGYVQESLIQAL